MNTVRLLLEIFAVITLVYSGLLGGSSVLLAVVAWRSLAGAGRSRPHAATEDALASPLTPGVSVIVPAYNEERGILESVHSLLALRYPRFEVIVINDGSADATFDRLRDEFDLVPVRRATRGQIPTKPFRGVYASRRNRDLCVIDRENGGKADALNAGVDTARYPYICAIDADSIVEEEALLRVAKPILDDPDLVVATGGTIRIVNGCTVEHGRVVQLGLPKSRLATFQVVEYFRLFLVGRVGWSSLKSLLVISGAFGLFRRSLIEEVGGYSTDTVCEDMELVLRLHRHLRDRGDPYRIEFVADPACWTEVPEDLRTLSRQRRRWQRGLGESLWRHRRLIGNPRYGSLGLLGLPFFVIFEFLGPLIEVLGPLAIGGWYVTGGLSLEYMLAFLLTSVLLGVVLSVAALTLEDLTARRHVTGRELARLLAYAVLENFGYRQLVAAWRALAYVDLVRRKKTWGRQRRRGFSASDTPSVSVSPMKAGKARG